MPYLNWKSAPLQQKVESAQHNDRHFELQLKLPHSLIQSLQETLQEVFQEKAELRIDLPQNWILFWKVREGESRLLIAHPQPEEWVATFALGREHADALLLALGGASSGDSLNLRQLVSEDLIGALSNLDLLISIDMG